MVIVGGDRGNLSVRHRDLRVERGEFQMLLVLLRAVVAAREREDQRVVALEFAELPQCARVIGEFVVGENVSCNNVRSHLSSSRVGRACPGTLYSGTKKTSNQFGDLIGGGIQCEMPAIDE